VAATRLANIFSEAISRLGIVIDLSFDAAQCGVGKGGRLSFRPPPSEKRLGRSAMLLPEQYAWFDPVLIAAIVVFVITLIGNTIGFGNRLFGALMSAILFAVVFGALVYFGYGSVSMSVTTTPSTTAPAKTQK
jgi:hypothetical protein